MYTKQVVRYYITETYQIETTIKSMALKTTINLPPSSLRSRGGSLKKGFVRFGGGTFLSPELSYTGASIVRAGDKNVPPPNHHYYVHFI